MADGGNHVNGTDDDLIVVHPPAISDLDVADAADESVVDDLLPDGEQAMSRPKVAREAYRKGDVELTRLAHTVGSAENHNTAHGNFVKSLIFGGLDGIITTFAVVASVAGADLASDVVIVMGFSNLIADGFSMGFGEYLSGKAEYNYLKVERDREMWEFENYREGEIKEMMDLYQEKGFTEAESKAVIDIISKKKDFFIDHMMVQELGLMPPDEEDDSLKQGLVMFCSFLTFGFIPLFSYVALGTIDFGSWDPKFLIACILTGVALFILGVARSHLATMSWYSSGFWMLGNGVIAAGVAYLAGYVTAQIVDVDC